MPFPFSNLRDWASKRSRESNPTHHRPSTPPPSTPQPNPARPPASSARVATINFTPRARASTPTKAWLRRTATEGGEADGSDGDDGDAIAAGVREARDRAAERVGDGVGVAFGGGVPNFSRKVVPGGRASWVGEEEERCPWDREGGCPGHRFAKTVVWMEYCDEGRRCRSDDEMVMEGEGLNFVELGETAASSRRGTFQVESPTVSAMVYSLNNEDVEFPVLRRRLGREDLHAESPSPVSSESSFRSFTSSDEDNMQELFGDVDSDGGVELEAEIRTASTVSLSRPEEHRRTIYCHPESDMNWESASPQMPDHLLASPEPLISPTLAPAPAAFLNPMVSHRSRPLVVAVRQRVPSPTPAPSDPESESPEPSPVHIPHDSPAGLALLTTLRDALSLPPTITPSNTLLFLLQHRRLRPSSPGPLALHPLPPALQAFPSLQAFPTLQSACNALSLPTALPGTLPPFPSPPSTPSAETPAEHPVEAPAAAPPSQSPEPNYNPQQDRFLRRLRGRRVASQKQRREVTARVRTWEAPGTSALGRSVEDVTEQDGGEDEDIMILSAWSSSSSSSDEEDGDEEGEMDDVHVDGEFDD